jgi:hypothetical protein
MKADAVEDLLLTKIGWLIADLGIRDPSRFESE